MHTFSICLSLYTCFCQFHMKIINITSLNVTPVPHTSILIPCIPTLIFYIPTILTLISQIPIILTVIPRFTIIPLITFPDSPFRPLHKNFLLFKPWGLKRKRKNILNNLFLLFNQLILC